MSGLKVAPGLELPIETVGESTAILAKKGAGKSNTAKVIVEETLDHGGIQVVVLDPIGHWWSLRAGANGKPRGGYPVAVFGGMHGDLPLEQTAGKLLAQTAVESGQSIVLDVSSLDSDGAMQVFAYQFAHELYKLKQATPTPLLLVLEEADEFAPQDTRGNNVSRMVGEFNRIVKRGRGRGIGSLVVSQRSAALNKNVLDQSDTLIVMRTIGPRDRKAIEGWVEHAQATGSELVLPSLPSLATGEAWIWTPERNLLKQVKVRKARTFDSSATPKPGQSALVAVVKPIDVEKLGAAIAATVEREKANDPKELRRRLAEQETLIRQLEASDNGPREVETVEVEVPVPALDDQQLKVIRNTVDDMLGEAEQLRKFVGYFDEAAAPILAALDRVADATRASNQVAKQEAVGRAKAQPRIPAAIPPPPANTRQKEPAAGDVDGEVTGPMQKVLNALAWWQTLGVDAPSRGQVAFVAGYAHPQSRGFRDPLYRLNAGGFVVYPAGKQVSLTAAGAERAVGPSQAPSEHELQEMIFRLVGETRARMLRTLIANGELSRDQLAAETGYAHAQSRGFRDPLYKLHALELVDYTGPGMVKASDLNFLP